MIFDKNITELKKQNTSIDIDKIEKTEKPKWFVESENNFKIKKGDKIYQAYNRELYEKTLSSVKKNEILKENITVFIGVGLGEFLYKLLQNKEKEHVIIVIEPEYYFLKLFFQKYDITKYLKNNTIMFVKSENEIIQHTLSFVESNLVVQNWFTLSEFYVNLLPEIYADVTAYTREMINQIQCNVGTVMGAGTIIAENDIKNLPYVIRHRGVNELKDLFKNKPAVIVSTGPSLNKNIHILKENQDSVIIIAVAQALRALMAYEIKPDFICTVDYGKTNMEHFEGLFNITDVPLVALNRTYAPILKKWKGPKFIAISDNVCFPGTVAEFISKKGSLIQAGSVSHFCLGLAVHLGCNNIGIIGQDLAYEGNRSHMELADASGEIKYKEDGTINWKVKDPNSHLNNLDSSMGYTQKVEAYFNDGINNKFLPTNAGLASFIVAFENIIASLKDIDVYNCTEGGANIKGTEIFSLRNFIKNFGTDNKETEKLKPFLSLIENNEEYINKCIPLLENEIQMLKDLKKNCIKGINTAEKLKQKNIQSDKNKLEKVFKENKKYSDAAQLIAKKIQLVGMHIYKASREIYQRKYNVKTKNLFKNAKNRKVRTERNIIILEAAKEAAIKLVNIYEESLDILKKYIETKDDSLLLNKEKELVEFNFEKCEKYFNTGNFAFPLLSHKLCDNKLNLDNTLVNYILNECIHLRYKKIEIAKLSYDEREKLIEYTKLVKETKKETDINKIDFNQVKDNLKKAIELIPYEFSARWGMATVLHHLEEFENSIDYYDKLIKDFPDNLRLQYERGIVLLNMDSIKGIDALKKVLEKTDQFDHIYKKLGDLYKKAGMNDESKKCYEKYDKKFMVD